MSKSKTYSVTCSAVGGFSYASNFKLYVKLTDSDGDSSTNKSKLTYKVWCEADGSGSISAKHALYFKLNGKEIINETKSISASSPDASFTLASGSMTVEHNNDGSKDVSFSAKVTASSYGVKASTSGTFALEDIPRYFSKKPEAHKTGKTETTYTIEWSTSETCSKVVFYMGSKTKTWEGSAKSGSITMTGLTADTKYAGTYIIATRKDSGLTTQSTPTDRETYPYPYIESISVSELTIGNSQTISLYNPLSRSVAIKMYKTNTSGTQLYSGSTTGTSITFTPNANTLYNSIPSAQSSTCVYESSYGTTSTKSGTYKIKGNEVPNFSGGVDVFSDSHYSLTQDSYTVILGYSNMIATIPINSKATGKNGSSIKSYKMVVGSKSTTVNEDTGSAVSMTISGVTSNQAVIYAIDTRGLSTSKTVTLNSVQYSNLAITSMSATRKNNIEPQTVLSFSINFWNSKFSTASSSVQNSITEIYYQYKKTTESSWTTGTTKLAYTTNGNRITGNIEIAGDLDKENKGTGFNIENSYNIYLFVRDKLKTSSYTTVLTTGLPAIAIYRNKVAIGAKYDETLGGTLQIYGKAIYGTAGLYSPHSAGIYFDQYGNIHNQRAGSEGGNFSISSDSTICTFDWKSGWSTFNYDIVAKKNVKIPKNGTPGYGLCNADGVSIIRDHNNKNITVDATGGILHFGWENTTSLNFMSNKATMDTNGSLFTYGSLMCGGKATNDGANKAGVYIGGYGAIQISRNGGNPYVGLYDVANGNSVTWDKIAGSIACSNISGYFNVNYGTAQSNYRLYVNGSSYFSGGIETGSWVHVGGNLTVKGNTYHDNGTIRSTHTYNNDTVTNSANMYVTSGGWFRRTTGSSERWKTDITEEIEDRLNPEALYRLPIKQFKYKDDCISKDDVRYGKNILGFIAEDVAKIYEPAVQYDEKGRVEMWNLQVMTPAILRLVQNQNKKQISHNDTLNEHTKEINNLQEIIKEIQIKINNLL